MHRLIAVRVAAVSAVLVRVSFMRMGLRVLLVRACAAAQLGPPLQQLLLPGELLAQWSTMAWGAVLQATCPLPQRREALALHACCTQGEMTLHCFYCVMNKTVLAQAALVLQKGTRGRWAGLPMYCLLQALLWRNIFSNLTSGSWQLWRSMLPVG